MEPIDGYTNSHEEGDKIFIAFAISGDYFFGPCDPLNLPETLQRISIFSFASWWSIRQQMFLIFQKQSKRSSTHS